MDQTFGVLIAIVSSCLGGSAAAVTRYLAGGADPITLAILRWGIGFALVLPVTLALRAKLPPRRDWPAVAALGVAFFGLFFIFYNIALGYTTAARAALALSTLPLQTMIVGALLGIEPLTARKSLGVAIAMLGVFAALVTGLGAAPAGAWRGEAIMTGAVLCMAFYNVWSRAFIVRSSALGFLCVGMGAGAAALILVGVAQRPRRRTRELHRRAMDGRHLSRHRRRRARLHSLGHGAATHDADAGRQHHDGQSDRRRAIGDAIGRRTDHAQSGRRPDRGVRRHLDCDQRRAAALSYLITSAGSHSDSAGMKVTSISTANITP